MVLFVPRNILLVCTIFFVLLCQCQDTATSQQIPAYLLRLYSNLTTTNNGTKLPHGATTVRGVFLKITKRISNTLELTVNLGSQIGTTLNVTRDEIHVFVNNTRTQAVKQRTQNYKLLIQDLTSKLIISHNITYQTSGWQIIHLHQWLQKWLNNGNKNNGLRISVKPSDTMSPTIDTKGTNQPYLIIYQGPKKKG